MAASGRSSDQADLRLGAYVLPGDPIWLERTLPRYYDLIDALVVPVPSDSRGWTGHPIPVAATLDIIRRLDTRNILREVPGVWTDREHPMAADRAQRQAAVDALSGTVDWIFQVDNDELIPDPTVIVAQIPRAEELGAVAIEAPMRVLFRRTRRWTYEVAAEDRVTPHLEYPGPVLVRSGTRLVDARRAEGPFLRLTVPGDRSLQTSRTPEDREHRVACLRQDQTILHNSWGRHPRAIRRKLSSWGHAGGFAVWRFYWLVWLPSPLTWRRLRDFHPFARGLWPRLRRVRSDG